MVELRNKDCVSYRHCPSHVYHPALHLLNEFLFKSTPALIQLKNMWFEHLSINCVKG